MNERKTFPAFLLLFFHLPYARRRPFQVRRPPDLPLLFIFYDDYDESRRPEVIYYFNARAVRIKKKKK